MDVRRPQDDEAGETQEIDVSLPPPVDPDTERMRWEEYIRTRRAEEEKERYIAYSDEERPFAAVLGISSPVTLWELRRRFHDLIFQVHPDRVSRQPQPEQDEAARQTGALNEAYAFFKQKYKL